MLLNRVGDYLGKAWKNHKYIRIENGHYIYPGDEKQGKKDAQDKYLNMRVKFKRLKRKQIDYENQIDDNSFGDKDKTKASYDAGDKLNKVMRKIDKMRDRMRKQRIAYKKTFNNKMLDDLESKTKPKTSEEAKARKQEIKQKIAELQSKRSEFEKNINKSNKEAIKYYKKTDKYRKNTKSDGYRVNEIIGNKYESAGKRYASKINYTDRKLKDLNNELKQLGVKWFNKKKKNKK